MGLPMHKTETVRPFAAGANGVHAARFRRLMLESHDTQQTAIAWVHQASVATTEGEAVHFLRNAVGVMWRCAEQRGHVANAAIERLEG